MLCEQDRSKRIKMTKLVWTNLFAGQARLPFVAAAYFDWTIKRLHNTDPFYPGAADGHTR